MLCCVVWLCCVIVSADDGGDGPWYVLLNNDDVHTYEEVTQAMVSPPLNLKSAEARVSNPTLQLFCCILCCIVLCRD